MELFVSKFSFLNGSVTIQLSLDVAEIFVAGQETILDPGKPFLASFFASVGRENGNFKTGLVYADNMVQTQLFSFFKSPRFLPCLRTNFCIKPLGERIKKSNVMRFLNFRGILRLANESVPGQERIFGHAPCSSCRHKNFLDKWEQVS